MQPQPCHLPGDQSVLSNDDPVACLRASRFYPMMFSDPATYLGASRFYLIMFSYPATYLGTNRFYLIIKVLFWPSFKNKIW